MNVSFRFWPLATLYLDRPITTDEPTLNQVNVPQAIQNCPVPIRQMLEYAQ